MLLENEVYTETIASLSTKVDKQLLAQLNGYGYDVTPHFPAHYIGRGVDSIVFKEGKYAVKFYCRPMLGKNKARVRDLLSDYQDVTNQLSNLTETENTRISLRDEKFKVRVNPILSLTYNDIYNCHIAISPFIFGGNANVESYHQLDKLVSGWMKELGITGMQIVSCNTKFQLPNTIMITDLCASISNLEHRK